MSSDGVHTIELSLRDTLTKSVTFAPERATVAREIVDLRIKVRQLYIFPASLPILA